MAAKVPPVPTKINFASQSDLKSTQDAVNQQNNLISTYLSGAQGADVFANRPVAGIQGRTFYATDTDQFFVDTGTTWIEIGAQTSSSLFNQTSSVTITGTVTETTIIGTGVGSLTLPANFLIAGMSLDIHVWGFWTSAANPTMDHRLYLNSTLLLDTGPNTEGNVATPLMWTIRSTLTCRTVGASGTIIGQGYVNYARTATTGILDDYIPMQVAATIDTTIAQTLNLTFQWGTANASSITCTNLIFRAF